jgi:hypothetical protein
MAFQVGTQVRPELGRADLRGFERSGQYIGQALANLGQEIGAGIKAKQAKKEKRDTKKRRSEYIYGLSQSETGLGASLRELGVTDEDSAGLVVETLGDSFVPVLSAVQEQIAINEDKKVLQTAVAVNTDTEGKVEWDNVTSSYIELGGSDPAGLAKLTEQYKEPFTARAYTVEGPDGIEVPVLQTSEGQVQEITTTDASDSPKDIASELVGRFGSFDEIPEEVRNKMTGQERTEARKISKSLAPATSTVRETPAQEAMSEEIGKSLAKWPLGGYAQAQSNLNTYDNLITGLNSGEYTTRTLADFAPESLGLDDDIRAIFNPGGQAAVDRVRQVLFQGLKDTLGNQFTQREAERLVSASYNPKLEPEENIRRLTSARNVLQATIEAKNAMYEHLASGGSISTYQGVSPRQVLLSGIKDVEQEFASDQAAGGFLAPSGIQIRSKRPKK